MHNHEGGKTECKGCREECAARCLGAAIKVFKHEMGQDPSHEDGVSHLEYLLSEAQHLLEIYVAEIAKLKEKA